MLKLSHSEKDYMEAIYILTRRFDPVRSGIGMLLTRSRAGKAAGHAGSDLHALAHAYGFSFRWVIGFSAAAVSPTLFLAVHKKTKPEAETA
ncbi:hypothetical protein [Lacrimispora indolis]|mgnify:CR=1 FL=1|uniref:hypothetical protein n=1 Tax=Lacrimispora indolis TaxID=69825 RepID=UPI00045E9595|nr:hypothetical protein [Lacrimispora indolis]